MAAIGAALLGVGTAFVLNPTSGKRVTFTDDGDGTLTATFAGTTAVTNSVYWAVIDDQWDQAPMWLLGGSRTGDGVVSVTVPRAGTYWLWALSAEATPLLCPPVWLVVSNGLDSVWERLLGAVVARIRSLGLADLSSSEVVLHNVVTDEHIRQAKSQMIVVGPSGPEVYLDGQGVVGQDDYDYSVLVAILHPANAVQATVLPYWKWRDRIKAAFQERQLPISTAHIRRCKVQPDFEPTSRGWWSYNVGASILRLTFTSRESRE